MTTLLIILVIVAGVAATLDAIVRDDRGHRPPPDSHPVDPAFLPPATLFTRR